MAFDAFPSNNRHGPSVQTHSVTMATPRNDGDRLRRPRVLRWRKRGRAGAAQETGEEESTRELKHAYQAPNHHNNKSIHAPLYPKWAQDSVP